MINFDQVAPEISKLLESVRCETVLARCRPDPDKAEPVSDEYAAVITFGQFQVKTQGNPSLDYSYQPLQYVIYFDCWCKSYTGEQGLDRIIPALNQALQGQRVEGLGVLSFQDCEYMNGVPRAIALYGATVMSQV